MSIFWLRAATALYAFGLLHVLFVALRRQTDLFRPALAAFSLGMVLHGVALAERVVLVGSFPAHNFYETMSAGGFLVACLFIFLYVRYQFATASLFLFPFAFLMTSVGATEMPVTHWSDPKVRNAWLLLHVALVLVGYTALLLTAIAAIFYLVQERQLKSKRPGRFARRLPPLGTLDELISRSLGWGFLFMTLGLLAGSVWAFVELGTKWVGQPNIAISFVTWGFCLLMVYLRVGAGWRGRKAAFLALIVLGCSAATWAAHVGLRGHLTQ